MMTTMQVIEQRGRQEGDKRRARLTVLRGHFRKLEMDTLTDISGLPFSEVLLLIQHFEVVKKAWKKQTVNVTELKATTTLLEEEVDYIIECLESKPLQA